MERAASLYRRVLSQRHIAGDTHHRHMLERRRRRATLGDCAFPVAAARAWNSLPLETRACSSLLTFRRETKSHLFCQSYSDSRQTSALSCATVLKLDFCRVPPQLCDSSTIIHDICSRCSSSKQYKIEYRAN